MPLIVIKQKEICRRREIGQPSRYCALSFDLLAGIGEVKLCATEQQRRPGCNFKRTDACSFDRQRKENVRVSKLVVVKKILCACAEIISIDNPSAQRN